MIARLSLASVVLLAATTVALLSHTAVAQANGEIVFGQTAPFSGGAWEPGHRFNAGLLGAFHEVNAVGGVKNLTLRLVSLDDQYDVTQIPGNVETLLAMPNIFCFVGFMGSPTTSTALPLAAAAEMPIIGPLTGSAVFRKTFNPWTINVRAGYDDEALTMLRLFVTEFQYQRISIIFQNDAFGSPAKNAILEAMAALGLSAASVHSYVRPDIPIIDYAAFAQDVWQHRPQGVILYCVEGFSNPFLREMYNVMTYRVRFITGSWIGDGIRNYLQANSMDPTNFYMTQVMPDPRGNLNITQAYRAALIAREGSAATFDFLSLEGYLVGRMVVEALRRTPSFDKASFLQSIYDSKMYVFDELLAGPFSNDCVHDPDTAKGRSSLCYCNQGLRTVSTTVLTSAYEYVEAVDEVMRYPITECWATPDVVVKRPLLLSMLLPTNSSSELVAATSVMAAGMAAEDRITVLSRNLPVADDATLDNETQIAMENVGRDSLLVGGVGAMEVFPQDTYPIFPSFAEVPLQARTDFVRTEVHIMSTLQQELFVHAQYINANMSALPVFLIYREDMPMPDGGTPIATLMQWSLESFDKDLTGAASFSDAESLRAALATTQHAANIVAVGLHSWDEMQTFLQHVDDYRQVNAFMTVNDVGLHWQNIAARYQNRAVDSVGRMLIATNFPAWSGTASPFAVAYQESMAGAGLAANISNPLYFAGYFVSRVLHFLIVRSDGDGSPETLLNELYRTSVIAMNDVKLGPYVDTTCTDEDCRCSKGAHFINVMSLDGIMHNADEVLMTTQLTDCEVRYTLRVPEATNYTGTIIAAVLVPIAVIAGVLVGVRFLRRHRQVACAPKNTYKFHTMFVSMKKETLLWERYGNAMPQIMQQYVNIVTETAARTNCYKVKAIGGAVMITSMESHDLLECAARLNKILRKNKDFEKVIAKEHGGEGTMAGSMSEGKISYVKIERSRSHRDSSSMSERSINSRGSSRRSMSVRSGAVGAEGALQIEFSMGLNYDRGLVSYDESRHHYDYSGPSVDGAAVASDKAQGGQILMTDTVAKESFEESHFVYYTETSIGSRDLVLLQFNPPGQGARTFKLQDDSGNVDSIAATLEQQSSGVTAKKVTVLSLYLHGLEEKATELPRDAFAKLYVQKLEKLQKFAKLEKGHIHSVNGPSVVFSFNAVSPTPQAPHRAFNVFVRAQEMEEEQQCEVSAGIVVESSLVGTFNVGNWRHDAIISRCCDVATGLQRLCAQYRVHCLAFSHLNEEFAHFSETQYVDVVKVKFPVGEAKPKCLIALRASEGGNEDCDEWMYELQNANGKSAFHEVNLVFEKFLSHADPDPGEFNESIKTLAQTNKHNVGLESLVSILEHLPSEEPAESTARAQATAAPGTGAARRDEAIARYIASKPSLLF